MALPFKALWPPGLDLSGSRCGCCAQWPGPALPPVPKGRVSPRLFFRYSVRMSVYESPRLLGRWMSGNVASRAAVKVKVSRSILDSLRPRGL